MAQLMATSLMDINGQAYYVLLSGRWASAKSLEAGDWSYVSSEAPATTSLECRSSADKDVVLASVARHRGCPGRLDAGPADRQVDRNTKLEVQCDSQPSSPPSTAARWSTRRTAR